MATEVPQHPKSSPWLPLVDRLLRAESSNPDPFSARTLVFDLGLAFLGFVVYGVAAGCLQGGQQILITAIKAPLIGLGAIVLCLPSLFVWGSLAGGRFTARGLASTAAGFWAVLALLLVGFFPINWLFSVSSRSLIFPVLLHLGFWVTALHFGQRFLVAHLGELEAGRVVVPWVFLVLVVSLQLVTLLQPVLVSGTGEPAFHFERSFFLERFFEIAGSSVD